jgi:8-oxo-dGTP pyrophosphatase MutT (NUDIX family)
MKRKYPIPVGTSILLNNNGELLLGLKLNGLWECLGGKIEDELVREGAKRELLEEIDVAAQGSGVYLGYSESYGSGRTNKNQRFVNHYFYWPKWTRKPKIMEPHKCQELKWFAPHALPSYTTMTQGTRVFADHLKSRLINEYSTDGKIPVDLGPEAIESVVRSLRIG